MQPCPNCKNKAIWKSSSPCVAQLTCQKCGHNWPSTPTYFIVKMGTAEGDWTPEELAELEKLKLPCKNWHFIKGRLLWFAFKTNFKIENVVSSNSFDGLVSSLIKFGWINSN